MTEKTCPRCAEKVKTAAKVCKHCGHEFSAQEIKKAKDSEAVAGFGCGLLLIVGAIFALSTCGESDEEEAARLKQEAVEEAENREKGFHCLSAWDGSHSALVDAVKSSLRDPGSFEHYETRITPENVEGVHILSMEYGARNGFGGMNRETMMAEVDNVTCRATPIGNL